MMERGGKKMRKVPLFIVCVMLMIVFLNPVLTHSASSHTTLTDTEIATSNINVRVSEEKIVFLIGIISDLTTVDDTVVFNAENVLVLILNPPGLLQYASGESITVSGCFGFFGVHFILACGKIQI